MTMEKHDHEAALPVVMAHKNVADTERYDDETAAQRRKQWKLKRLVALGFLLFGLWNIGDSVRSLHRSYTSDVSPLAHCGGGSEVVQGYFDRVTGSQSRLGWAYSNKHDEHEHHKHDKHDKHHKDKHHKHDKHDKHHKDKHDHHHKDKHGKHGPGHHGPHPPPPPHGPGHHGPHGPPKWISPKEAEEIFLTIPTNDSIRAYVPFQEVVA